MAATIPVVRSDLTADTFTVYVDSTPGEGCFDQPSQVTVVQVLAHSVNDATLVAMQIVAARGRCPIDCQIDWTNF